MRKIDIHVHARMFRGITRVGSNSTFATPEELIGIYEKLGVEKGVVLPGVKVEHAFHIQSNEDVIDIVQKYPGHFDWFCNIDPRMGKNSPKTDLSHFINYYKQFGAKGVGEIVANMYFDDPMVENLFFHCEKTGMPVIFHIGPQIGECYGLVDEVGLPRLEKELGKFPNLIFLGHSQPFWQEISTDVDVCKRNSYPQGKVTPGRVVDLMRKYPNLHGDLSAGSGYNAVSRDLEFGYAFIEEFQDRLYFGTDIASPQMNVKLSFWLDEVVQNGKISEAAYRKISRENALKLLGE